jgi:hypothetical protein
MKRSTLLLVMLTFLTTAMTQNAPSFTAGKFVTKALKNNVAVKGTETVGSKPVNHYVSSRATLDDPSIIVTKYDLQSNSGNQNRLYLYPDGTVGATSQMSHSDAFGERGTGYNYFDGTAWGTPPAAKVEGTKSGWPSYDPMGTNGEIFSSHHMTAGLYVCKRADKGTGAWTESILPGPASAPDISWPVVVTNGPDRNYIHILCVTYVAYQGMTNCLLYYRSLDGGQTWDINGQVFADITSSEYLTISADTYRWAEPKGDTLCFVVGDSWNDLFIMKSTDNGDNWTKTIIWPCPYNLWTGGDTTGTFWCPDGASAVALDNNGKAHVLTGLQRGSGDETGAKFWVPKTDGMLYWNEDMPQWPEVLDPDQLFADGNLIGWLLDTNVFYLADAQIAFYYNSLTSQPSIAIDDNDNIYAAWAGATMNLDPDNYALRHLFGRGYNAAAGQWNEINDLTDDFLYTWSECVFPSMSPTTSEGQVQILFQEDEYAGSYVQGLNATGFQGQGSTTDNNMVFLNRSKYVYFGIITGQEENNGRPAFEVSQNYPNPAPGHSSVAVNLAKGDALSLKVTNTTGQMVYFSNKGDVAPGQHTFAIDCSSWTPGIYFYTVQSGKSVVTKKMVVR